MKKETIFGLVMAGAFLLAAAFLSGCTPCCRF